MFSYLLNKHHIKTSNMAIVMSFGITIQGVILNFFGNDFFYSSFGKLLSWITLLLWFYFSVSFVITCFNIHKFKQLHYENPINRFGIGTWVAGTSLCSILIYEQLPNWSILAKGILFSNVLLWTIFIIVSFKSFIEIYKTNQSSKVHGILLLTTVSTQSIVISFNTIYDRVPPFLDIPFILFGICLYLISFFFIIKRYYQHPWTIENDWSNTNCIMHGALSITGVASIVSGAVSQNFILFIWSCVLLLLLLVEIIEGCRFVKRIKRYGIKKAILTYDLSQWSRIFTFSMFYTFTILMDAPSVFVSTVQNVVKVTGIWVVFFLIFMEIALYILSIYENRKTAAVKLEEVS